MNMRHLRAVALALAIPLSLMACSKSKKVDVPVELTDIKNPTVRVHHLWTASVGGGGKKMRLGLGLAAVGDRLYAAGPDGDVAAFDRKTGRQVWRVETKLDFTGGTGASAEVVAVGSANGVVVALSAADGAQRWRATVNGEVLSAPAVAATEVVVRTVDGKLRGLDIETGRELWLAEQQIPRLTLRGAAAPVVSGEYAITGFDNGRVMAVNLTDGATVWDTSVSPPQGRTELERLNDIDAAVKVMDREVFVVGFQGRAAMLALDSGQIWWTQDISSYRAPDVDDTQMYVSTSSGELVALTRRTGTEVWRNESLKFRGLSAPTVVGDYVTVTDLDGYVHWFDRATGAAAGRGKAGGGRVTNPPLAVGGVLYLMNDKGEIHALSASPVVARAARGKADPKPVEPPADEQPAAAPGG